MIYILFVAIGAAIGVMSKAALPSQAAPYCAALMPLAVYYALRGARELREGEAAALPFVLCTAVSAAASCAFVVLGAIIHLELYIVPAIFFGGGALKEISKSFSSFKYFS